ncbi:hypothetical protein [Streptomyces sp. ECR3.8]|uniref:hypothetical protein n=1 Tax=Streptomyces sp. ECR3.8 TaxID=3461009 RepID=UPI00404167FC
MINTDDIAALREQGDLKAYLLALAGLAQQEEGSEPDQPGYHIPRKGAWPCGTAATGPTPSPCSNCQEGTAREPHPKHP